MKLNDYDQHFFFETANIIHDECMQNAWQLADKKTENIQRCCTYTEHPNPRLQTMRLKYTCMRQAYPCHTPEWPKTMANI